MSQAARDCDLVALGQSIAELVQHSTMVVEGSWTQIDSDPVHRLPFARWTDCLPECARALRLGETDHDLDAADTLDMRYLLLHGRVAEAVALGRSARSRNPNHAYARYIISLCGDTTEGLRAAEEGLHCPDVTPFLRRQMLWRAVEFRVWEGSGRILAADVGDTRAREEGTESLRTALDYVNIFLAEAPQDAYLRLAMLGWNFLLSVTLRGPDLSDDLLELKVMNMVC